MRAWILLLPVMLGACGLTFVGPDGHAWPGSYNQITKGVEANIDGKVYKGTYVRASSSVIATSNVYGNVGMTPYRGTATGVAVVNNPNGQAILVSQEGDSLRCDFVADGMGHAVGSCVDNRNRVYRLMTNF